MLFVLAHIPSPDDRSPQARALRLSAETARQCGIPVVALPFPFSVPGDLLPDDLPGDLAVYSGPIPRSPEHYRSLQSAIDERGGRMVNESDASDQATRIEHWCKRLDDLTAATVILREHEDLAVAARLGFPLFVKGGVKSAKERGLQACLADTPEVLEARAVTAWRCGHVLAARQLLALRQTGDSVMNFPAAREYRVTLLDGDPLGASYYWAGNDPLGELSAPERREMLALAVTAAGRLDARLLAIDVGQIDDGSWRVVEVGDAQHTGLVHIPPHRYWTMLRERLDYS